MARWYGTTAQRGLDGHHVTDKKRLLKLHHDGDPCWRCGQPMYKTQALDRDHVVDRVLGGAQGQAVLAHAACNRGAGATMGNQLQPRVTMAAARDVVCAACGKPYHYAARSCEVCGAHYHPSGKTVRTCGRACGVILSRRNRMAKGWVPRAQRPKPPPKPRRSPVASGEREPKNGWPATPIAYYTCRYCGTLGLTQASRKPGHGQREVCAAEVCQRARLAANNLRTRHGLTAGEADAQVAAIVASGTAGGYGSWQAARQW